MMANMNEQDRIWAETNLYLALAKDANTRAEVERHFVVPFLESDNGAVMSRLDILQFHQCTWESSQLSYIDFIKQLSMLAGKARIPDDSPSMIRLFIEKQPKDIKIGLNNLCITKGEYVSLRRCMRDPTILHRLHQATFNASREGPNSR
jgi:hypothetical protein